MLPSDVWVLVCLESRICFGGLLARDLSLVFNLVWPERVREGKEEESVY